MQKIDLVQSHDVIGMYEKLDFNQERRKYTDPGTVYAFDVLDGKITTGYLIKLAAFRHLRDLQRQGQADFPYTYDIHESEKLLKFASICPNVDTGEPTKLMDWQKFIFSMLFGWRNREGGKRFTRAIVSVARGQGKTYLMAILMCYSYLIESLGLSNQDYLVASINFKQTNKLYGYIKSMLRQIAVTEPFKSLADETELSTQSDQTIEKRTNNVLRAISFESGQFDSFHFTTAIVDEIGEVKSRDKVSKIISGQVKIKNKQFIQISTSYPDPSVPFHEDQKMLQQAMEQDWNRDADSYLGLIWAQDDLDETFKDETWVKSNPLLQLPDQHDVLLAGLRDKRDSDMLSGVISDFQNKNLNLWLQESTDSFLKLNDIESAIIDNFSYDGQVAYLGFDYSMSSDNTALAFVIPYADTTGRKWHVMQHSFIPWQRAGSIEAKEKQDGINYRDLAKKGYCTITAHEQGLISTEQVFNWLVDFVDEHKLKVVFFGYDAMGVNEFIKRLEYNTSYPLQAIRQRTGELKDPTKFLQKIFVEGSVTRFDDKIMEKALINAQLYEDKVGIQVDKAKATLKIDVVDAIIDAMYQAMYHFEDFGIVNDKSNEVDLLTEQDVLDWFNSNDSDYTD
ncbi:terminase large subunit [Ligilactobacillus ruminis]|jgi:phage terminase large subunit-like protein|uniref:terminase large subunit n=1 Tax=Ligilactobacillus ruminis TaxID=1623 RepID=UPI00205F7702|nr:terminase TerL endonuclease subunit [Ligilactobacillus ruminis]DAZ31675.1 MAG TPA: Large Terminase [Caudoviricetes sp.]